MESIYAVIGDYENFMKYYTYDYEEELVFENTVTWEVAYGCLNYIKFAEKINNNKKIIKCEQLMRMITTSYLVNDIINIEMIDKYPPYYLTYPKIIKDEIFYELIELNNEKLKIPLAIIAIIKNREDIFLNLDPEAYVILYSFAKQYKREKCIKQQIEKSKKFNGYNIKYTFIKEEEKDQYYNNTIVNTKMYLKYYAKYNQYMCDIFPEHFDMTSIGTLGLDYLDLYGIFKMAIGEKFNNVEINKNLYNDPIQISYVYNNLEKFNKETCRIAISKLILSEKEINQEIIEKYKPYNLTKELTLDYCFLKRKYPTIKKDIEKAENIYKYMIKNCELKVLFRNKKDWENYKLLL